MFNISVFFVVFFLLVESYAVDPRGVSLGIQVCSGPGNCQQEGTGLVIDYHWTGCQDAYSCYNVSLRMNFARTSHFSY